MRGSATALLLPALASAFTVIPGVPSRVPSVSISSPAPVMAGLSSMDLTGKTAFVAGVADSTGYGWAICKALASAGCKIIVGTWPPVLGIFEKSLKAGKFDEDMILPDGSKMVIEKVYPLDAVFDTPDDITDEIANNKRYAGLESFTIEECAAAVAKDYGKIDVMIHSLANGPEGTKPLLETSRKGYLAAQSASAYSMVSLVQRFGPIMNKGGSVLSLTYIAHECDHWRGGGQRNQPGAGMRRGAPRAIPPPESRGAERGERHDFRSRRGQGRLDHEHRAAPRMPGAGRP